MFTENYMGQALERLPGGVFIYRISDGQLLYANQKMIDMLECDNFEDMLAFTGGRFANVMHEEDRRRMQESIAQQIQDNEDQLDHLEYRVITKTGRVRFLEDYGQKVMDEKEGELFYVFVADMDRKLLAYDMDELTNLPRQHRFVSHAQNVHEAYSGTQKHPVYVYFDLSNFKMYNLNFGMHSGDVVLMDVAKILKDEYQDGFVGRAAEDHFLVMTDEENMVERAQSVLNRIDALEPEANIFCRAGICRLEEPFMKPSEAVNLAREACDNIRREAKEHIQVYSKEHSKSLMARAYATNNIDEAIAKGEIQVYYQPVIRALSRSLCGFEALARWNSATAGFLAPYEFIPALEGSQQIHKLDCEMIRQICRQYREKVDRGEPVVPVSFNLSRLDFQMCDIVQFILDTTAQYEVPHHMLRVEITETTLASDDNLIQDAITRFHEEGFQVWMDDFGSGYSSLNSLKDYQFDKLKIDMIFLSSFNEKSQKIIASIVQMAKSVGIHTLAEGVETEEQYEFLRSIGCEEVQGYFFGKPMLLQDSFAQTAEIGVEPETREEALYYGKAGAVEIAPKEAFAILEDDGSQFRFVYLNRDYTRVLASAGELSAQATVDDINDPNGMYSVTFRERLEQAEANDGFLHFAFPYHNNYLTFNMQILSHSGSKRLFKLSLYFTLAGQGTPMVKLVTKPSAPVKANVKKTVLVVDDEPINLMMLGAMLKDDYKVLYAENGQKALEMIREDQGEIEAVLLDMLMPVMDGMEVLRILRTEEKTKALPVLAMTSAWEMQEQLFTEGASMFLPKPFETPEIIRAKLANAIHTVDLIRRERGE